MPMCMAYRYRFPSITTSDFSTGSGLYGLAKVGSAMGPQGWRQKAKGQQNGQIKVDGDQEELSRLSSELAKPELSNTLINGRQPQRR